MQVDTMRFIDRWAGVPLCFLLTIVLKIRAMAAGRRKQDPIRNVLFIELSEMGSTILADPALNKTKGQIPGEIFFLIFAKNRASLALTGTVPEENIFTLREHGLAPLLIDTWRFLVWSRKKEIDTVIDLELFSRFTALLSGASGAKRRVGFYSFHNEGLYRGEMLTHRVAYNPHIHIGKNFIALVNGLLSEHPEVPYSKTLIADEELVMPRFRCSEQERERVRRIVAKRAGVTADRIGHLVLINPNASELLPQRRWMGERYEELIKRILDRRRDLRVAITGAPSESDEAAEMVRRIGSTRCFSLAGALKLTELPVLYLISALMVTNDSGPGHFSAITPLPTFVLFGPETPALYGSLGNSTPIFAGLACSPCVSAANHRKTPCTDNRCLQAITVDQVFSAIEPVLDSLETGLPADTAN